MAKNTKTSAKAQQPKAPVKKTKKPAAKQAPALRHTRAVLNRMAEGLDLDHSVYKNKGELWQAIKKAQDEQEGSPGRKRRWTWAEQLEQDIDKYIGDPKHKIKSVVGFCVFAKISRQTLNEYRAGTYDSKTDQFSDIIKGLLDPRCEQELIDKGLQGEHNPAVTIFALKNLHSYADKIEMSGPGGEPLDGGSKMVDATNAIATAMEKHFKGPDREGDADRELPDED